jgi:hypothetical protein
MSFLIPLYTGLSQTLSDYIKAVKGDTLVVKDYSEMGNAGNSLYQVMTLDTGQVPAGRVYELKAGGYYPLYNTPVTQRRTVIVGSDYRPLVRNNDTASPPPLVCGGSWNMGVNTGGITVRHDLTLKNCNLTPCEGWYYEGWVFAWADSPNAHMTFDNCLFEHTRWVFVGIGATGRNCGATLRNCYFVNMNGQPCRRSAGAFDAFAPMMDTLLIENCTHVMAAGTLYRFRASSDLLQSLNVSFKRIIFNHNTFVNCAGYVFMHPGYQDKISLTSNLFINSNVQSYPAIRSLDKGEQDAEFLPMGLVNVYPDSTDGANGATRKFLCMHNLAYWDPSFENMEMILDSNHVNGVTNWQSQRLIMNSRTTSLFADDIHYPFLTTDSWMNKLPAFTDPKDLFTTQLAHVKAHALAIVDTLGTDLCPDFRLTHTDHATFLNPDWPIPVDLSYSDADLRTAGLGGFPLGDLNWFPTQKAAWLAQRTTEYAQIQTAMDHVIIGVAEENLAPSGFRLEQNYPNPFNPSTQIKYTVGGVSGQGLGARDISLIVYDVLGREVAVLVDEKKAPGSYEVTFDGSHLSSGVYFYRLTAGSYEQSKTMVLLK